MTLTEVRQLLADLDLRPRKALGQNFLVDQNIRDIILQQADLRPDDVVLEIGPGLGALTESLVAQAHRVIAIEKDARLCAHLREQLPGLELIEGDAVEFLDTASHVLPERFHIVANLPYSVSSPLLERLVEGAHPPRRMVVMIQREVAQRLTATPRHKDYGALTVFTQLRYHVTIAHIVSPRCFHPEPQVDSAIVVLERRDPRVKLEPATLFHELVQHGFGQRRKMLRKLLASFGDIAGALHVAQAAPLARAEELSLEQWITVANYLRHPPARSTP